MGTQYETQYKDGETPDHISSNGDGFLILRVDYLTCTVKVKL